MRLRKYWQLFRVGFKEATTYRLMALGSFASTLIYVVLLLAVWTAISQGAELQGGLTRVVSYIILGQAVNNTVSLGTEKWFGDRIREGTITNELKRPVSLMAQSYLHEVGWKSFDALSKSLPILVIGVVFTGLSAPSFGNLAAFGVSVFLSLHLVFSIALASSMLVFWTKIDTGLRFTRSMVIDFFSGVVFPLYLLPDGLRSVFYALPFHLIVDGPINVFLMQRTGGDILALFAQQLLWTAGFMALAMLLWLKAKKKLTVQGG